MKPKFDARTDPDVPRGMSLELLADLHLLTRDGQLNADARRKLKQIRHLVGLLRPALDDVLARYEAPSIIDCGAGKSYLGFLLYELVLAPANKGELWAVESRPELTTQGAVRARKFGHMRMHFVDGSIADAQLPAQPNVVAALHACDTATDDALLLGITRRADHIAVVPCCQAEVARQLDAAKSVKHRDAADYALFEHGLHRREFGSHLTNVVRALALEAHGYQVTVTELVGWEHSAKNEIIVAKRVGRSNAHAQRKLDELLQRFAIAPALVRGLAGLTSGAATSATEAQH
ncbi:MAG TPA: SAM-dependent methyltransferase [Kofleriaceae bacterium]|nr:SAM-dependent methyltransferase [Kofleriaceae bacterium]